jgi:hypothetical protein
MKEHYDATVQSHLQQLEFAKQNHEEVLAHQKRQYEEVLAHQKRQYELRLEQQRSELELRQGQIDELEQYRRLQIEQQDPVIVGLKERIEEMKRQWEKEREQIQGERDAEQSMLRLFIIYYLVLFNELGADLRNMGNMPFGHMCPLPFSYLIMLTLQKS